jgi:phosphoglycerate dehydrogenase-like enzyme
MTSPAHFSSVVHVALGLNQGAQALVQTRLAPHAITPVFLTEAELALRLSEVEWLLSGRPPRIDWSAATRLKLIHVAGTGVDPLFPALGLSETVHVTNSRGAHADAVRDHVLLLALALTRDLPRALSQQQRREWKPYSAPALTGQRWLVLGYGAIGQRVSRAANALGVDVHAFARHARVSSASPTESETLSTSPRGSLQISLLEALDSALPRADALVLCLPLTNETRGLFHAGRVALLPPTALVLNVSRGGILDETALLQRLQQGSLRGAGLDVFEHEPLPANAPHWTCPRLLITPHVAGFTPDYLEPVLSGLIAGIAAVQAGETPPNSVSRRLGY